MCYTKTAGAEIELFFAKHDKNMAADALMY